MNNKLTIVLNDKDTLMELAKDPEMQIRVKDAVIDAIGKRALKIANIADTIIADAKKELKDEFFAKDSWGRASGLKPELAQYVRSEARIEFNNMIADELSKLRNEIKQYFTIRKLEIKDKMENINIESIIREVAEDVIRNKFK